jgi:hypothetical protein
MPDTVADKALVGCCGLYCAACGAYRKGRCPGCAKHDKATWCKVRLCCREHGYATCAECAEHGDPRECARFHNLLGRLIGWVLNSDRPACIARIRQVGAEAYATEMAARGWQKLPRRGRGP